MMASDNRCSSVDENLALFLCAVSRLSNGLHAHDISNDEVRSLAVVVWTLIHVHCTSPIGDTAATEACLTHCPTRVVSRRHASEASVHAHRLPRDHKLGFVLLS